MTIPTIATKNLHDQFQTPKAKKKKLPSCIKENNKKTYALLRKFKLGIQYPKLLREQLYFHFYLQTVVPDLRFSMRETNRFFQCGEEFNIWKNKRVKYLENYRDLTKKISKIGIKETEKSHDDSHTAFKTFITSFVQFISRRDDIDTIEKAEEEFKRQLS